MTDTNRAEPMKGLADWLRAQAAEREQRVAHQLFPHGGTILRQWAAEVEGAQRWFRETAARQLEASRLPLAGAAPSDALARLRHDVRTAWMTGVPNFREFYDEALYAVLGITCLQDLYRESATSASPAPSDAAVQPVAWMHDGENRLDICHATIKKLLIDAKCGKQVEHYTIPLYDCAATSPLPTAPAGAREPFQQRVQPWMMACFGPEISRDTVERNHRFLEESLELVQSLGCTQSEAHQLVDYVFGRLLGDPEQEAGGVMVTLAALCLAQGLDMHEAGEIELARIWTKVDTIRAKQAAKPKHSPLPAALAAAPLDRIAPDAGKQA